MNIYVSIFNITYNYVIIIIIEQNDSSDPTTLANVNTFIATFYDAIELKEIA